MVVPSACWRVWEPHLALPVSPWDVALPASLPMCATGEGYRVPDLPTAVGTPLCLYALSLPLPAKWPPSAGLLAEPVGRLTPTVDGQQTHAALRGWVFRAPGLSPRCPSPSSSCTQEFLGAASPIHLGSTLSFLSICVSPGVQTQTCILKLGLGKSLLLQTR